MENGRVHSVEGKDRKRDPLPRPSDHQQPRFGIFRTIRVDPVSSGQPAHVGGGHREFGGFKRPPGLNGRPGGFRAGILQIFRIAGRHNRIIFPREEIDGQRSGLRVGRADEDTLEGDTGCRCNPLATVTGPLSRDKKEIDRNKDECAAAAFEAKRRGESGSCVPVEVRSTWG